MIRTVTYDDSTHKILPIEPDDEQLFRLNESLYDSRNKVWYERASDAYKAGVAAAPEYQVTKEIKHYGWALLDGKLTLFFTTKKEDEESWKGKNFSSIPLYSLKDSAEYQEPVKDE